MRNFGATPIIMLSQTKSSAKPYILIRNANGEGDRDGAKRSRGGGEFQLLLVSCWIEAKHTFLLAGRWTALL